MTCFVWPVCYEICLSNLRFFKYQKHVVLNVQEPDPHISVAWLLGDQQASLQQHLVDCKPNSPSWEQSVDQILCTVGQKNFSVWSSQD